MSLNWKTSFIFSKLLYKIFTVPTNGEEKLICSKVEFHLTLFWDTNIFPTIILCLFTWNWKEEFEYSYNFNYFNFPLLLIFFAVKHSYIITHRYSLLNLSHSLFLVCKIYSYFILFIFFIMYLFIIRFHHVKFIFVIRSINLFIQLHMYFS